MKASLLVALTFASTATLRAQRTPAAGQSNAHAGKVEEHTVIVTGSSAGGLAAAYVAFVHPGGNHAPPWWKARLADGIVLPGAGWGSR